MKRCFLALLCGLFLTTVALAQTSGRLMVTVKTAAEPTRPAAPAVGAKVFVVHWTNAGLHPTIFQDQVATTNQMGVCSIELPPGTYDIFVSGNGLAPAAFQREITAGQSISLLANLKPAPSQLRPIE